MLERAQKRFFSEGEKIFTQGETGDCAYIIESGRVEVSVTSDAETAVLTTLGVGEIFGEMSVLDGSPRSASATAMEPCILIIVSSEALSERFQAADPVVRLLINVLLKHVRFSNQSQVKGLINLKASDAKVIASEDKEQQKLDALERLKLEADLKQGLDEKEFQLHFQPIVSMETCKIVGFEALIRWNCPTRGMVRPDVFMEIAEETSLIVPIGKWVIEKACECLAKFEGALSKGNIKNKIFMSINISGRQFHDVNFMNHLEATVANYSLSPKNIKLEVTERCLMEGTTALQAIKMSRAEGFLVALDDFGTGYSSLSYFNQFDIDVLKIDQSFVRSMKSGKKMRVVTQAIASMASGMELSSIAEGIETDEDYQSLKRMGCDYGQGYLFSKPLPFDNAYQYLINDLRSSDRAV
ncbi:MAG: EAL domain-containing protein [Pseudobacteriovorax sp.]|nr:EAL domain-containing protein [Pseudobacteriovorax sp.]